MQDLMLPHLIISIAFLSSHLMTDSSGDPRHVGAVLPDQEDAGPRWELYRVRGQSCVLPLHHVCVHARRHGPEPLQH